jgi:hypothetical protein
MMYDKKKVVLLKKNEVYELYNWCTLVLAYIWY